MADRKAEIYKFFFDLSKELPPYRTNAHVDQIYNYYFELFEDFEADSIFEVLLFTYLYNEDGPLNIYHQFYVEERIFYSLCPKDISNYIENKIELLLTPEYPISMITKRQYIEKLRVMLNNIPYFSHLMLGKYKYSDTSRTTKVRDSIRDLFPKENLTQYYDNKELLIVPLYETWIEMMYERYSGFCSSKEKMFLHIGDNENMHSKQYNRKLYNCYNLYYKLLISPNTIKKLMTCNERLFISILGTLEEKNAGHATALIIDLFHKRIAHFDPMGSNLKYDRELEKEIKKYDFFKGYKILYSGGICPYHIGVQLVDLKIDNPLKSPRDKQYGYCVVWSLIFMEYVIKYPNKELKDINNDIIEEGNLPSLLQGYTSRLMKHYFKLLDDGYVFSMSLDPRQDLDILKSNIKNGLFFWRIPEHRMEIYKAIYNGHITFNEIIKLYFTHGDYDKTSDEGTSRPAGTSGDIDSLFQMIKDGTIKKEMKNTNIHGERYYPDDLQFYESIFKKYIIDNNELKLMSIYKKYFDPLH